METNRLTRALLEYCSVGLPGSSGIKGVAHAPLSTFLQPLRAFVAFSDPFPSEPQLQQGHRHHVSASAWRSGVLPPSVVAAWFASKRELLALFLQAYARRFGRQHSTVRRAVAAATSQQMLPAPMRSVFSDIVHLVRRGVEQLSSGYSTNRDLVSAPMVQAGQQFLFAFLADLLAMPAIDALVPIVTAANGGGVQASFTLLAQLVREFLQVHPAGVKHVDTYRLSCTTLPSAWKALTAFVGAQQKTTEEDLLGVAVMASRFDAQTQSQSHSHSSLQQQQHHHDESTRRRIELVQLVTHLWFNYMHLVLGSGSATTAERFATPPQGGPPPIAPVLLFGAWKAALRPVAAATRSKITEAVPVAPLPREVSPPSMLRRLLWQLHVSHALFHAVPQPPPTLPLRPGDPRSDWAADVISKLVWPVLHRLPHDESVLCLRLAARFIVEIQGLQ
jgi:hypothetical protein